MLECECELGSEDLDYGLWNLLRLAALYKTWICMNKIRNQ